MALTRRKRDQMARLGPSSDSDSDDRDPNATHKMAESDSDDLSDSLSDTSSASGDYMSDATDTSDVSDDARGDCSPRRSFPSASCPIARDDDWAAVKSDACLTEYAEHLRGLGRPRSRLRNKMRELGRLLVCSRKSGPLKTMRDHVAPGNFMHAVRAVKRASGFDAETKTYGRPSLVLKLSRDLKAISRLAESRAGERGDRGAVWDARHFREAYEASWRELLTDRCSDRKARIARKDRTDAPPFLRFTRDVQALHSYLDAQQLRSRSELLREPTPRKWALLTRLTLAQVVLFNRHAAGDVAETSLSAYLSTDPPEDDGSAAAAALSQLERELCRGVSGIRVLRAKGEEVTVLLTPLMRRALDLLVAKRRECRVPSCNAFLFGRPLALDHFRGEDAVQFFARFCGAESPGSLTSPKLREQTGALSQVLNLRRAELKRLTGLLGCDKVTVDWRFYRRPGGTLPLAKICKMLIALERDGKGRSQEDDRIGPDVSHVSRQPAEPQGGTKAPRCKNPKNSCRAVVRSSAVATRGGGGRGEAPGELHRLAPPPEEERLREVPRPRKRSAQTQGMDERQILHQEPNQKT
ncbi:uncharacterized protein [Clinocottus analis]|uniref:uncharacterized protein isoform X2 n=1 Tax=Clinocottus analis TaxID=304258 RepID=UPI0035C12438